MRFSVVGWPSVVHLAELSGFQDHSFEINDPKGNQMFGSDAYFVSADFIAPASDELTFMRVTSTELQMFQLLDGYEENSFFSKDGSAFISEEWLQTLHKPAFS